VNLLEFITKFNLEIVELSEKKTTALASLRPISSELKKGLPLFLGQLVMVLEKSSPVVSVLDEQKILKVAGSQGREFLRLGYTLSHVVHAYGAICQAITQLASEKKARLTSPEFHNLNRCLDIAIAGAVTEFEAKRNIQTKVMEVEYLGCLAHELRNALSRAVISSEMIIKGVVGSTGSTSKVLQVSLSEIDTLLNKAIWEIKTRSKSDVNFSHFFLIEVLDQLLLTAGVEADRKGQTFKTDIDPSIELNADEHLIRSALANVIQNAIKYTKKNGALSLTVKRVKQTAVIQIEDECGGLSKQKIESLLKTSLKVSSEGTGMGLGLAITQKALKHCKGKLSAKGTTNGCVFTLVIPCIALTSKEFSPVV